MKKIVSPHSNVSLDQRVTPYGPKCQLCGCQGSVLIDEGSGLPSITRPLFIVPECGHSLCRKCRQRVRYLQDTLNYFSLFFKKMNALAGFYSIQLL